MELLQLRVAREWQEELTCQWLSLTDPESGIDRYEWAVSDCDDPALPTLVGWTEVPRSPSVLCCVPSPWA